MFTRECGIEIGIPPRPFIVSKTHLPVKTVFAGVPAVILSESNNSNSCNADLEDCNEDIRAIDRKFDV